VTVEVLASARAALEATRGVGGTPTRLLYFRPGGMTLNQAVGTISPTEAWAKYAPYRRHYAGLERSGFSMAGDVTFDDFIWQLNTAVKAVPSGVITDTSAYTWTFLPTETSDDIKSALIQFSYGDFISTWGGSLAGCIVNHLTVHWTKNVADDETGLSYTAELMSAAGVTQLTAFTGALSDRSITSAVGPNWQAYVDTATIGSTPDTRITEATYELENGYVYRDGADNTGHAIEIVRGAKRITSLTYQRYFNSKAELDAYIAKTVRKVRLLVEGAVVGAATAKNTVKLDYYGVIDDHTYATGAAGSGSGLIYANIKLRPLYDTVLTSDHQWVVINTSPSIT
jgi:hypothetical protein